MRKPSTRQLLFVKIVVTLVLVSLILVYADWSRFAGIIQSAHPLLVGCVFLLMVCCVTISAWKWRALLRIHGLDFDFWQLHRWYFVAMFFNNFLPTSIGGDAYRVWRTLDNPRSRTSAVLAVFVERLSGILTLLLLGFVGALIGWLIHGHALSRYFAISGVIGTVFGISFFIWLLATDGMTRLRHWRFLPQKVIGVIDHLDDYLKRPLQSVRAVVGISFVFHFVSLFWLGLLISALGGAIQFQDLALVAALISVVAVVPLSINGIGVVDGSFIWLTGQFGVDYETALGAMLLQRALLIPISLLGAMLYFRDGKLDLDKIRRGEE